MRLYRRKMRVTACSSDCNPQAVKSFPLLSFGSIVQVPADKCPAAYPRKKKTAPTIPREPSL